MCKISMHVFSGFSIPIPPLPGSLKVLNVAAIKPCIHCIPARNGLPNLERSPFADLYILEVTSLLVTYSMYEIP